MSPTTGDHPLLHAKDQPNDDDAPPYRPLHRDRAPHHCDCDDVDVDPMSPIDFGHPRHADVRMKAKDLDRAAMKMAMLDSCRDDDDGDNRVRCYKLIIDQNWDYCRCCHCWDLLNIAISWYLFDGGPVNVDLDDDPDDGGGGGWEFAEADCCWDNC